MKLRSTPRALLLVGACIVAGIVSVPALAFAKGEIVDVFITNTDPIRVAPQGTTPVTGSVSVTNPITGSVSITNPITGTVTVANPTPAPPPAPIPVQGTFGEKPITKENPFTAGTLYDVPEGKLLVVEFFQAHWLFSGIELRQANLRESCVPEKPPAERAQVFFPDQEAGVGYHVVGGPTKMLVPGGSCLNYEVGADHATFPDTGLTLYVYGGFSGYLIDDPVA